MLKVLRSFQLQYFFLLHVSLCPECWEQWRSQISCFWFWYSWIWWSAYIYTAGLHLTVQISFAIWRHRVELRYQCPAWINYKQLTMMTSQLLCLIKTKLIIKMYFWKYMSMITMTWNEVLFKFSVWSMSDLQIWRGWATRLCTTTCHQGDTFSPTFGELSCCPSLYNVSG